MYTFSLCDNSSKIRISPQKTPWTDLHQIWHSGSSRRHNHSGVLILWWVEFCNFLISRQSPLAYCCWYRAICNLPARAKLERQRGRKSSQVIWPDAPCSSWPVARALKRSYRWALSSDLVSTLADMFARLRRYFDIWIMIITLSTATARYGNIIPITICRMKLIWFCCLWIDRGTVHIGTPTTAFFCKSLFSVKG